MISFKSPLDLPRQKQGLKVLESGYPTLGKQAKVLTESGIQFSGKNTILGYPGYGKNTKNSTKYNAGIGGACTSVPAQKY